MADWQRAFPKEFSANARARRATIFPNILPSRVQSVDKSIKAFDQNILESISRNFARGTRK